MGKKGGGWFSTAKKVFKNSTKNLPERKSDTVEKWQYEVPKVFRFVGYGRRTKERAAIIIQSYYRRYLARRALRALKGLVRLQALVRGHNVRKQSQMTLQNMQALQRVQARARTRRLQLVHRELKNKLKERRRRIKLEEDEQNKWSPINGNMIVDETRGKSRQHDFEVKRDRTLAHALAYQFEQNGDDADIYVREGNKPRRDWNWLEKRRTMVEESSYVIGSSSDEIYEKNAEMKWAISPGPRIEKNDRFRDDVIKLSPYTPRHHAMGLDDMPSYMAPTQSAKAKVRVQGQVRQGSPLRNQWNLSTKPSPITGLGYEVPRSPSPRNNRNRARLSGL